MVPLVSLILLGGSLGAVGPVACIQGPDGASSADTLHGRVMTENGEAPIPGASLRLHREGDVREATSDSLGRYMFSDLPAGRHELQVSAEGYRTMEVVVHLPEQVRFTVDVWLEPGGNIGSSRDAPDPGLDGGGISNQGKALSPLGL